MLGPWPNDPLGPQARASADVYWIMFVCAIIVLALVGRGPRPQDRPLDPGRPARDLQGTVLRVLWHRTRRHAHHARRAHTRRLRKLDEERTRRGEPTERPGDGEGT